MEPEETPMELLELLVAESPPIRADADGVLRVGGTRVRFETVVNAFKGGCAAEEILLKYPSLDLTDIYAVITYYLWHRTQVDGFLSSAAEQAEASKQEVEHRFPPDGIRERLLARRAKQ
jgi:uncharacterized protein (DUF433 family)